MRSIHETSVTVANASSQASFQGAEGLWLFDNGGFAPIAADGPAIPATVLIPGESVRLLIVDLPLASRAKRLAALPFAIEDKIADSIDAVHIALGDAVGPDRYLVGVVARAAMAQWVAAADAAGLGHARMVPDALALPVPPEGCWTVDCDRERAVVRTDDGAGFACPAAMLRPAWDAAGRPPVVAPVAAPDMDANGNAVDAEMREGAPALVMPTLGAQLAAPGLDLRQGAFARRGGFSGKAGGLGRWLVALLGIAAVAHLGIAVVDTMLLRSIADRRAAETRGLVEQAVPGFDPGEDLPGAVVSMLPRGGGGAASPFLPLLSRVSSALQPVQPLIHARSIGFSDNRLTIDMENVAGSDPAEMRVRIETALRAANLAARVTPLPDGGVRIVAEAGQ